MHELIPGDTLTLVAADIIRLFHGTHDRAAPSPASDLTFGQIRLLFLLHRDGPQPMGRVAEVFDLQPTAVTGFVKRVERHALVERHHRSDDRRVVECGLTDAGRRFVENLSGNRLDVIRGALTVLEPDELEALRGLLRRIHERQDRPA